jgi:hypothetical protein
MTPQPKMSRRVASVSSALVVAGIAAVASYSHMRHLALEYGQTEAIADMLPISVDGMLVVATVALGDGRRYRWSAWLAFWIGVTASIIANVLAAEPSAIARCISAWPAVAFLLVVEVITRGGRGRVVEVADEPADQPELPAEPVTDGMPSDVPAEPHPTAVKIATLRKRHPRITQQKVAERLDIAVRTVARHWPDSSPVTAPDIEPVNGRVPDLEGVPS